MVKVTQEKKESASETNRDEGIKKGQKCAKVDAGAKSEQWWTGGVGV